MEILARYEMKILLAIAAAACLAASSMDYNWPVAALAIRALGVALAAWAVLEPPVEEGGEE